MNLAELIEYFEIKLATHKDLTPINLKVAECTLKELKGKRSLFGKLNDDMTEKNGAIGMVCGWLSNVKSVKVA